MSFSKDIILFHYSFSPYAKRIVYYLNFRKIPYTECIQAPIMPRPDIAALGVSYRRIPILSIGRDIYNDTRLILSKLELLFPPSPSHPSISASTPSSRTIEKLLEFWTVDSGIFARAAQLIPTSTPLMQDKKFMEDRAKFGGVARSLETVEMMRPEAIVDMRGAFEFLEGDLLGDGREWILGVEGPGLADIEGVWPFIWLKNLPNALPFSQISPTHFPKTFAWISRFEAHAKSIHTKPPSIKGNEALRRIENSEYAEREGTVDENDPSGLRKGREIEVWPIDSGFRNRDRGRLVALSGREIVVEGWTKGGRGVRIHAPRHGFRIAAVTGGSAKL